MGLAISHDTFRSSYLGFDIFRWCICDAMGGSWPTGHRDTWFWGNGYSEETHPGLKELLNHSDCEGIISPEKAGQLAAELSALRFKIVDASAGLNKKYPEWMAPMVDRFIAGCRKAASLNEPLEFC